MSELIRVPMPRTYERVVRSWGTAGRADEVCDSVADEVEINRAITQVSLLGGGCVYLRRATYTTAASIIGASGVYLIAEAGTVITGAASDYRLFYTVLSGTTKTVYSDIKLAGIIFLSNYGNCVLFNNTTSVRIEDCEMYFNSPTALSPIRQGIYLQHCNKAFIERNDLHHLTGNGISVTDTTNFSVNSNTIDGGDYCDDAIDVDFDFSDTSAIHAAHGNVLGNTISNSGRGNGIRVENSDWVTVQANDIIGVTSAGGAGIKVNASSDAQALSNVSVLGNTVSDCLVDGIAVQGLNVSNVQVKNNTLVECGQAGGSNIRAGINLNASDVECTGNTLDTCGKSGADGGAIVIDRRDGQRVSGNTIRNSITAIRFWNGSGTESYADMKVKDNKFQNNTNNYVNLSVASGDIEREETVTTTNATVTTLSTIPIPSTTTTAITGYVTARRTGGSAGTAEDGALYRIEAVYKDVAGTPTSIGSAVTVIGESQAGWNVTLAVSGTNVLVQVTGAVNNNISWAGSLKTQQISS